MAFYREDDALAASSRDLKARVESEFVLGADDWAFTWVLHKKPLSTNPATDPATFWAAKPAGATHRGAVPFYPASVPKLFWLVALEAWLEAGKLQESAMIDRARRDMIGWSSNEATNYLIDVITGTTSGPELPDMDFSQWTQRRFAAQKFFMGWQWPELVDINLVQKFCDDDRYGREREFVGVNGWNHNRLTTDAASRILIAIMGGVAISLARSERMAAICHRSLDPADRAADPSNQVDGFLGEGLPAGAKLWSKAGLTLWTHHEPSSWRRHDAAYVELPSGQAFMLAVFTQGRAQAENKSLLPFIGRWVAARVEDGI
ncbi:MAG: serine hydrolase [Dongiaceae bacterium]